MLLLRLLLLLPSGGHGRDRDHEDDHEAAWLSVAWKNLPSRPEPMAELLLAKEKRVAFEVGQSYMLASLLRLASLLPKPAWRCVDAGAGSSSSVRGAA